MVYSAPPPALADTLGSPWVFSVLFVIALVSQASILIILGPIVHDVGPIQLMSAFNPQVFFDTVNGWSAEDKLRFDNHFIVDEWLHPTLYSMMFMSWLTMETAKRGSSPIPYFLFLVIPPVAGFCDMMENNLQHTAFRNLANASEVSIRLSGVFATSKWLLIVPTGVWCLVTTLKRRNRSKVD